MKKLVNAGVSGHASGKAILIGEHAAVDGHMAIALPLKDQTLTIRFGDSLESCGQKTPSAEDWNSAWSLVLRQTNVTLPVEERRRLTQTLQLALTLLSSETGGHLDLNEFVPQRIEIVSELPLGAGMGGSAALSAALIRALLSSRSNVAVLSEKVAFYANELDGVFHGRASGLDAAAVVSDSIISFTKASGSSSIRNACGFWILLVDTQERTPTRDMVQKVAELRKADPALVESRLGELGLLATQVRAHLEAGELLQLGEQLTHAHGLLKDLSVSTPALDDCVTALLNAGALGAKLTGGGGGGLALGLFASRPALPLSGRWNDSRSYLTFVPANESP
jgi:mevalonate kinase